MTALMGAAQENHKDMVDLLLGRGAFLLHLTKTSSFRFLVSIVFLSEET